MAEVYKVPAWAVPTIDLKPCEVCGQRETPGTMCDECREYFRAGFGVVTNAKA